MAQWTPENEAEQTELCKEFNKIFMAGTEEQQAAWMAGFEGQGAPDFPMADIMKAVMTEIAGSADGLLDEAKYIAYEAKQNGDIEAKYGFKTPMMTEELLKRSFAVANKLTPGTDGVSLADLTEQANKCEEIMKKLEGA